MTTNENDYDIEETEAIQEDKRTSYLDVIRENLIKNGRTTFVYRVIICGELLKDVDKTELGTYYQRLFKQFQNDSELITGILMFLKSASFVHGSRKVILAILRDLGKSHVNSSESENGYMNARSPLLGLTHLKILVISEDVESRYFPFWASRAIEQKDDLTKEVDDVMFSEESIDNTVADICISLIKLGSRLSSLSKSELKPALDELGDKYKDIIPSYSIIVAASRCKDIISIQEWLEYFDGDSSFVLESEVVWPISKPITIT